MPLQQSTVFDTNNEFPWESIQTTIDTDTGLIRSTRTLFDAGYEVFGTYENGILIEELFVDSDAVLGFTLRTIRYDANGQIIEIGTVFPDGTSTTETFVDGLRVERIERDTFDGVGVNPWEVRTTRYDSNGQVLESGVVFDDGTATLTLFEDGLRIRRIQDDIEDAKPWQSVFTNFDANGVVTNRETVFDNGIVRFDQFQDGVRTQVTQLDNVGFDGTPAPDGGVRSWQEIYTNFDLNGVIANRETVFDNGVLRFEEFVDGVRSQTTQLDNVGFDGSPAPDGGAQAWQEIYTNYDMNGVIANRETVFDDGVLRFEEFVDGVRSQTTQLDNVGFDGTSAPDGGAKPWQEIYTTFDADGVIATKEIVFDNGVVQFETYENGQRTQITLLDNIDPFGTPPADGGAKPWGQIVTTFDANGNIASRETIFDNGVRREEAFEAGTRSFTTEEDVFDFTNWDAKLTTYDANGVADLRATIFDNGDQAIRVFEDSALEALIQGDGDNSESWEVRLTEYTPDGPVTTDYDSQFDLPQQYLDLFGFMDVA